MKNNQIYIRRVEFKDQALLLNWANQQVLEKTKINTRKLIKIEEHKKWFLKILKDQNSYLWIIYNNTKPIGQLRIEWRKNNHEIDIFITKEFRKFGLGSAALKKGLEKLKQDNHKKIIARVKGNNEVSKKFFKNFGFKVLELNDDDLSYIYYF